MNTLEERLERSGYTKRLKEQEQDKKLVESIRRDHKLSGRKLPASFYKFEEEVIKYDAALAAEYERTAARVDSRNDLEFTLLELQEQLEIAAEECEATDPERAAKMRSIFPNALEKTAGRSQDDRNEPDQPDPDRGSR